MSDDGPVDPARRRLAQLHREVEEIERRA